MPLPPCGGLQVLGPTVVDDGFKALHVLFDTPYPDIWARATVLEPAVAGVAPFVLGFTEWVGDQAYYGGWWRTGGISFFPESGGGPAQSTNWNVSGTGGGNTSGYGGSGLPAGVYDLRVTFVDSPGGVYSRFDTEVWHDGVQEWVERWHIDWDGVGGGPFTGVQAIAIINQSAGETYYLDDISVGTTRGASNVMSVVDFNDHTFGAFVVSDGSEDGSSSDPMVDSFSTDYVCGGGGGSGVGRFVSRRF